MLIQIRPVAEADAALIEQCNAQVLGYPTSIEETRERLSYLLRAPSHILLIAEYGGIPAGYVHAQNFDVAYAPHLKDVLALAVLPEFQKMGIGRALMRGIEKWAQETGAAGVRLVSGETRKSAHAFYLACGYHDCKGQRNFKKIFDLPLIHTVKTTKPNDSL